MDLYLQTRIVNYLYRSFLSLERSLERDGDLQQGSHVLLENKRWAVIIRLENLAQVDCKFNRPVLAKVIDPVSCTDPRYERLIIY